MATFLIFALPKRLKAHNPFSLNRKLYQKSWWSSKIQVILMTSFKAQIFMKHISWETPTLLLQNKVISHVTTSVPVRNLLRFGYHLDDVICYLQLEFPNSILVSDCYQVFSTMECPGRFYWGLEISPPLRRISLTI